MSESPNIHPTAIVDKKANIHPSVQIGPWCIVGPDVTLEEGVVLNSHSVVKGHTTLKKNVKVFQFTSLGENPQDLKFKGEPGRVIIGEGTHIREFCSVHIGTQTGRMQTTIGARCLLMANSHVAHDCIVEDDVIIAGGTMLAGHVTIGTQANVSGLVGIHQFTRVGRNAFVAAGAICVQDVMPFCFAQGDRAGLRGINKEGLKRRGFSPARIQSIKDAYRTLFREGRTLEDALKTLEAEATTDDAKLMLDFARTNKRSLMRP